MVKKWFKVTEENELEKFGYSPMKSLGSRRMALRKAVESTENSGLEVYHKLLGLSNVTQNSQPTNSKKYKSDANYIKRTFIKTRYW